MHFEGDLYSESFPNREDGEGRRWLVRREERRCKETWEKYERLKQHMRRIRGEGEERSVSLQMVMSVKVRS